uniref:Uncharacterized protein n=1 Tax=Chrysotila carterae TaxID=13221 RepID=A0A7S4BA13_CHRCT
MAETYDKKPTLHAQLKQMGMSKDEYCSTVSENAELAGLASSRAIEEFCRQGKAPIKRSGKLSRTSSVDTSHFLEDFLEMLLTVTVYVHRQAPWATTRCLRD